MHSSEVDSHFMASLQQYTHCSFYHLHYWLVQEVTRVISRRLLKKTGDVLYLIGYTIIVLLLSMIFLLQAVCCRKQKCSCIHSPPITTYHIR